LNDLTTKSSLSGPNRRLIELMQTLNFGRIEGLHVHSGQPVFDPPPRLVQKLKMGGENGARPEASMHDFLLKHQTIELLGAIARIGDGQVLAIEVKNGLAFSMEIEHQLDPGAGRGNA